MTWKIGASGELPTYTGNKTITGTLTVGGQILAADGTAAAPGYAFSGAAGVGFDRLTANIRIGQAPTATANRGLFNLGSGPFDGATAGFFVGSSSGTLLAGNAASGFAGNLLDLQVAGVQEFRIDSTGALAVVGHVFNQRNLTNPQQYSIYNTTDASVTNYERANIGWAANANIFTMGTDSGGTGTGRATRITGAGVQIGVSAIASIVWQSEAGSGHWITGADNTYDIGKVGGTRPRAVYVAGLVNSLLATATTAGGAKAIGLGASGPHIYVGSGVPSIAAVQGSLYLRTDGSTTITRAYINTDSSTTWTPLTTVG